jgi:hypothetical protein
MGFDMMRYMRSRVWKSVLSLKIRFSDRGRGEYNTIMLSQSQHLLGPV